MKVKIHNDQLSLSYVLKEGDDNHLKEYLSSFHKTEQDLIKWRDPKGRSLLHIAAKRGNLKIINSLIKKGLDLDAVDSKGNTAIHYSILQGDNNEIIRAFINAGANLDIKDKQGESALSLAVGFSDSEIVHDMLKSGANPNTQNNSGYTPMHGALLIMGGSKVIQHFVDAKADLNIKNKEGYTPLNLAVSIGILDLFSDEDKVNLLQEGVEQFFSDSLDSSSSSSEGSQLDEDKAGFRALQTEINKSVKVLINSGASLDIPDKDGNTALHNAALNDNYDAVRNLIQAGCKQDVQNNVGNIPLHIATRNNIVVDFMMKFCSSKRVAIYNDSKSELLEAFISSGANLDIQDEHGSTAMQHVIAEHNDRSFEMLIKAKADLNIKDNEDRSAMHYAVNHRNYRAIQSLMNAGIDISIQNDEGYTATHLAIEEGNVRALKILTSNDKSVDLKEITVEIFKEAIKNEDIKTIEVVLGGNKELREEFITHTGRTWLSYAVAKNKPNAAAYMIEQGFYPQRSWEDVVNKMSALDIEKTPYEVAQGIGGETLAIYRERNKIEREDKSRILPEKKKFTEKLKRDSSTISKNISSR